MSTKGSVSISLEGIGHVLSDNMLAVPLFQRPYAWESEQVGQLLSDLESSFKRGEGDRQYFLGSIVLAYEDRERAEVVDGQQRLATASILLAAIRDYFARAGDKRTADLIETRYLLARHIRTLDLIPRLRLNERDNDFFARSILAGELAPPSRSDPESHKRLAGAAELAKQHVLRIAGKREGSAREVLIDWVTFLERQVQVIVVEVPDQSDAFTIFETLNDRGAEMDVTDLLKNHLLRLAGRDRLAAVDQAWSTVLTTLESEGARAATDFVRHLWSSKRGLTRERQLYTEIRDAITTRSAALAFAEELSKGVSYYAAILDPDHVLWDELGSRSRDYVTALTRIGVVASVAVSLTNSEALEPLRDLSKPYTVHLSGFAGLSEAEGVANFGALRRAIARGHASRYLRNALRELAGNRVLWQGFQRAIAEVFPKIMLEVTYNDQTDEHVSVFVRQGGSMLPLDSMGTGALQAIQILAYLHLFKPRVLLLDEPDSHLHPDNQRRLIRALWRTSELGYTQVISTTHSRHVVDAKPELARLIVISDGGLVPRAEEKPVTLLMELGAIDDTERLLTGRIKCVVATEDSDTEEVEHVVFSSGFVRNETLVCSYAGCSKVDSAVVLATFVRRYAPGVSLVIHRDRDYLPEEDIEKFRAELAKHGIHAFVTVGSDIETHYLNAKHIVAAHPMLSVQQAQDALDRAVESGKEESLKALVRKRSDRAFRERNKKDDRGKYPDLGEIAVTCKNDVERSPSEFAYGKHTLGLLKQELQVVLKDHPQLYVDSPHLTDERLRTVAVSIWPEAGEQNQPRG